MATAEKETEKVLKTCLVTLVTPGQSDRVIKVYPAEHETEKIWLTNTQGIERWEAVLRLMNNYAERGTRVPHPAPYHDSSKDLRTVTLKSEDIPVVRLDGAVLKAPPLEEKFDPYAGSKTPTTAELAKEIGDIKGSLAQLAVAVTALLKKPAERDEEKPRDADDAASSAAKSICRYCNKDFSTTTAMKMHVGRFHKNEVK